MTTAGLGHHWLVAGSGHSSACATDSVHWEMWRAFKRFLAIIESYCLCLGVDNVAEKLTGKGTGSPGEEC